MYSLFFGKLWRDFRIPRRSLFQIHIHLGTSIYDTPANSTSERIQEKFILPILPPVAHRGIKHTALAMRPRPHHWIRRTVVALALHAMRVQREDHVKIGHKILQRVPLFVKTHRRSHAFQPRKFRVIHDQIRVLQPRLPPVSDELSAEHPQVGVFLISMRDIAIGSVFGIWQCMKRVARCVHAHKSHSIPHRVQQCLLAFGRHRGLAVCAHSRKVSGGEEHHAGVGMELFESKMRPSFVNTALNPCLFPRSFTASSMMLGFPSTLFTTACSNPDDFVNTSTDLMDAPTRRFESASPAPVSAAARRNSLRLENSFMESFSSVFLRMLATRGLSGLPLVVLLRSIQPAFQHGLRIRFDMQEP